VEGMPSLFLFKLYAIVPSRNCCLVAFGTPRDGVIIPQTLSELTEEQEDCENLRTFESLIMEKHKNLMESGLQSDLTLLCVYVVSS
jgi:hypothetical protein